MQLRGGKVTIDTKVRSKGFNVKGRAADPRPTNFLVSNDDRKLALAAGYNVPTLKKQVSLAEAFECANQLDAHFKLNTLVTKHLLIGYGPDWLYFGRSPLDLQGPRPVTKAAKADPDFPAPPGTDEIEINVFYDNPALNGDTSKSRDSVMGDSALNYASSVYGAEWAAQRKWEWLHIVAHSLGGDNQVGNLVAGTFEANTQMIPHERNIHVLTQTAATAPVSVSYKIDLFPDSWVAIGIRMSYSVINGAGFCFRSADFSAQADMNFDKLQYDIWGMR